MRVHLFGKNGNPHEAYLIYLTNVGDGPGRFSQPIEKSEGFPNCKSIDRTEVELVSAQSKQWDLIERAKKTAQSKTAAARQAEQKRLTAERAARAAYLAKLPTLQNGAEQVFIGSDR